MGLRQQCRWVGRSGQSRERREGLFEVVDEPKRGLMLLRPQRQTPALAFATRGLKRRPRAGKPLSHIDVAKDAALERPRRRARLFRTPSEQRQRMLEQGHELWRREIGLHRAKHEIEESAGHGLSLIHISEPTR